MPDITIKNLTIEYKGKRKSPPIIALNDFSAQFEDKSFNVVVGFSGCGKTTLLRTIAGLVEHGEDKILFDGDDVYELMPSERNLSFVSQQYVLYPHMTIFDNIAYPLKTAGASRGEIYDRVNQIAKEFDIVQCLTRKPKHLSGGQQQRVALARAFVKHPSVCLLDEPLSNVDAQKRLVERVFIKESVKRYGCTAIYVTHDFGEAMALADTITVIHEGRLRISGKPLDVFNSNDKIVKELRGKDI